MFDKDDRLLYVGITASRLRLARFAQHARDKDWWHQVKNVRLEHIQSREDALAKELEAIKTETPMHNLASNPNRGKDPRPLKMGEPDPNKWTFYTRHSDFKREIDLFLYPEPDFLPGLDDVYYEGISGEEELEYYAKYLERKNKLTDEIGITWFVSSIDQKNFFYFAPALFSPNLAAKDFLQDFTVPQNTHSENVDWYRLPVKGFKFPTFWDAVGWLPSPFQKHFPILSIVTSRWGWY